jgi:hypothetical protein
MPAAMLEQADRQRLNGGERRNRTEKVTEHSG